MRELALTLLEAISESLGLEKDCINKALGQHGQHMAVNYYPPCPQPELTYGLPGHTDPNAITLLLQDEVPGLQVLKDGKWLAVNPLPNTFTVNIGDQIQVYLSISPCGIKFQIFIVFLFFFVVLWLVQRLGNLEHVFCFFSKKKGTGQTLLIYSLVSSFI